MLPHDCQVRRVEDPSVARVTRRVTSSERRVCHRGAHVGPLLTAFHCALVNHLLLHLPNYAAQVDAWWFRLGGGEVQSVELQLLRCSKLGAYTDDSYQFTPRTGRVRHPTGPRTC